MKKLLLIFLFALGFFSLTSQTLVIREFIISFSGNELGIGLFYAFWFFWVGIGASIVISWREKIAKHFLKLICLYPLFAIIQIYLFISLRELAMIEWWAFFPLEDIFVYLFLLTSLISLFTGIIFTLGITWLKNQDNLETTTSLITSSYIWESLGSFIAGIVITIFFLKLFSPIIILLISGLFFSLIAVVISQKLKDKAGIILNILTFLILLFFLLASPATIDFFSKQRLNNVSPYASLVKEVNTPYQQLIIADRTSQRLTITNGQIISSFPEVVDSDKDSAIFIAQTNLPKRVLVFGYGVENLINSLLKFPIDEVIYCLEDKVYYQQLYENLSPDLKERLADKRVKIVFQSPRIFLRENKEKFDLIVSYIYEPATLVANLFFTEDFFLLAKNNLCLKGALATRINSAENYLGEEVLTYCQSLYYSLAQVFPKIVIVPGDINIFFAGSNDSPISDNPLILEERLKKFLPVTSCFLPEGFRTIFLKQRVDFVNSMYKEKPIFPPKTLINRDIKPMTFFFKLLVLARYSNSFLVNLFKDLFKSGGIIFILGLLFFFFARVYFLLKIDGSADNRQIFNSKLFQFLSGFLGFSFHLILIYLFQNTFGTIFQYIGLVNGLFMIGLCLGGFFANRLLKPIGVWRLIISILLIQIGIILVGYLIFTKLSLPLTLTFFIYIIVFLLSGMVTGSSYPLVADILDKKKSSLIDTTAILELLDYWGAGLGAILLGLFLIPLLGVNFTICLLVSVGLLLILLLLPEIIPERLFKFQTLKPNLSFLPQARSTVLVVIALTFLFNYYFLKIKEEIAVTKQQSLNLDKYSTKEEELIIQTKDFNLDIVGFGGPINLKLRVANAGKINEIDILEHNETKEYVGNDLTKFISQFKGRSIYEEFSLKNIDAISGATITSRAVVDIVNKLKLKIRQEPEPKTTKQFSLEPAIIALLSLTVIAIVLYLFFPSYWLLRKLYLFFVVVILGFYFNLVFSSYHLANLLLGKLPLNSTIIVLYLLPVVLGLFLGQFWCGWLCPFGALSELLAGTHLKTKVSEKLDRKLRYAKYVFLTIFIIAISVLGNSLLFSKEPLVVFFSAMSVKEKFISFLVLFFSLFFLRFWCRYFCLCGAFLSLFNKVGVWVKKFIKRYNDCPLGVKNLFDPDCLQCNLCLKEKAKETK